MPDVSNALVTWLLGQLELMPVELLANKMHHSTARLLAGMMSEREMEEAHALLDRPTGTEPPLSSILLPGIMGSLLGSIRGLSSLVWLNPSVILDGKLNLLELADDGETDRSPYVEIVPMGIEKFTYLPLILTLARESKLHEFPYDWRRHLEWNAQILGDCIARWATSRLGQRFVLVGHSMGGLLARTYLALRPAEAERYVDRVILLASPLRGAAVSALAFSGIALRASLVSKLNEGNDVGRLARNFPACYQLLPPPPDLFPSSRAYPFNWDLYDASQWDIPGLRQDYLNDAQSLHRLLARSDPQVDMVHVCGCNCETITDIWRTIGHTSDSPYTLVQQQTGSDAGDDTVPLWSVHAKGVATYYVNANHISLPSSPPVLEAMPALLRGEAPGLSMEVLPSGNLLRRIIPLSLAEQAIEMRRRLESGEFGREEVSRLFFMR